MSKQLHMLKFDTSLTHVILIKRYINFTSCLHNVNKYSCLVSTRLTEGYKKLTYE